MWLPVFDVTIVDTCAMIILHAYTKYDLITCMYMTVVHKCTTIILHAYTRSTCRSLKLRASDPRNLKLGFAPVWLRRMRNQLQNSVLRLHACSIIGVHLFSARAETNEYVNSRNSEPINQAPCSWPSVDPQLTLSWLYSWPSVDPAVFPHLCELHTKIRIIYVY